MRQTIVLCACLLALFSGQAGAQEDLRASNVETSDSALAGNGDWRPNNLPQSSIIIGGSDDRKPVPNTKEFPYSAIVQITFLGGPCTGWMIGIDTVVTAGHCIRWQDSADFPISSYRIFAARDGDIRPFRPCRAKALYAPPKWREEFLDDYDYGAIKLDCAVGEEVGWFGFFMTNASLNGSPSVVTGYKPAGTMWTSKSIVTESLPRLIRYKNDTEGGQSGSPVYSDRPGCGFCVIGIHTGGDTVAKVNEATRLTAEVYGNLIAFRDAP